MRGELRGVAGYRGGVRGRLRRALREPDGTEPLSRHRVGVQLRGPPVHAAVHLLRRSRGRAAAARGDPEDRDPAGHPDVERHVDGNVAVPPGERPVLVDLQRGGDQARDPSRVRHALRRGG